MGALFYWRTMPLMEKKRECGALIIRGHHTLGCRLVERDVLSRCMRLICIDEQTMTTTTMTMTTIETWPTANIIIREAHTARFQQINLSMTVLMRRFLVLPSVPS